MISVIIHLIDCKSCAKIVQGERNAKQKTIFYLSISEPQPVLPEHSEETIVQGERNAKFI